MSANIAYAAPYVPPPAPPSPWDGIPMTWTGWNGSVWPLTDRASGLYLRRGVRGLGAPPHERISSVAPGIPGSRHKGSRVLDREVFWPVRLWHDSSSAGFVRRDSAFWRTMDPDQPGVWTVNVPGSGIRHLACRFDGEEGGSFDLNPVRQGWAGYGLRLLADRPLWYGDVKRETYRAQDPINFFGGVGGFGPPFHIMSGSNLATATMTNPGDVPAYPTWTVTGPFTEVTVGVGPDTATLPKTVIEGQAVRVITDPTAGPRVFHGHLVADPEESDGWAKGASGAYTITGQTDITREIEAGAVFAPIPAGQARPLNLAIAGQGTVTAEIVPQYRRAW